MFFFGKVNSYKIQGCKLYVGLEHVYMRLEVNSNRFEISFRDKISLWCEVTSLPAFIWLQAEWNSLRCKFDFGQFDRSEISNRSEFSMSTANARSEIKLRRIIKVSNYCACTLLVLFKKQPIRQHLFCIKFALIKRYYLHMCNRVLLLFGRLPHWNLHVNCHVNGTTFQSGLRFQTGLSSLWVSCKRALKKRE